MKRIYQNDNFYIDSIEINRHNKIEIDYRVFRVGGGNPINIVNCLSTALQYAHAAATEIEAQEEIELQEYDIAEQEKFENIEKSRRNQ